jgi:hypothetical protein
VVLIPFIDEDLMVSALSQVREGGRETGGKGGREGERGAHPFHRRGLDGLGLVAGEGGREGGRERERK